jgi:hypothetical protein
MPGVSSVFLARTTSQMIRIVSSRFAQGACETSEKCFREQFADERHEKFRTNGLLFFLRFSEFVRRNGKLVERRKRGRSNILRFRICIQWIHHKVVDQFGVGDGRHKPQHTRPLAKQKQRRISWLDILLVTCPPSSISRGSGGPRPIRASSFLTSPRRAKTSSCSAVCISGIHPMITRTR